MAPDSPKTPLATAVLLAMMSAGLPASAQEENTTELSESQLDLNARGVELVQQGEFEQATKLFESSLALGKSNITYLNLGRTYARMGRCADADRIYQLVGDAPAVPEPPRDAVTAKAEEYRSELDECRVTLVLDCRPPELQVAIDGGEPTRCTEVPARVEPGAHVITTHANGTTEEHRVTGSTGERLRIVLVEPEPEPVEEPEPTAVGDPVPQPDESSGALRVVGWGTTITGAALLTVATVLDLAVTSPDVRKYRDGDPDAPDFEQIRGLQRTGKVLFAAGAVFTVGGGILLLTTSPGRSDSETEVTLSARIPF